MTYRFSVQTVATVKASMNAAAVHKLVSTVGAPGVVVEDIDVFGISTRDETARVRILVSSMGDDEKSAKNSVYEAFRNADSSVGSFIAPHVTPASKRVNAELVGHQMVLRATLRMGKQAAKTPVKSAAEYVESMFRDSDASLIKTSTDELPLAGRSQAARHFVQFTVKSPARDDDDARRRVLKTITEFRWHGVSIENVCIDSVSPIFDIEGG